MDEHPAGVVIGLDIGGSHASGLAFKSGTLEECPESFRRIEVDSTGDACDVLGSWASLTRQVMRRAGGASLQGIGIAMPGPFDYAIGVSYIKGLGKFDKLYGLNIREELHKRLPLREASRICFMNDAACFALGEYLAGTARGCSRLVAVTLGTGVGGAFVSDGHVLEEGPGVPPGGTLYNIDYRGKPAEEWFSSRGLLATHASLTGEHHESVAALVASIRNGAADPAPMRDYGTHLGKFLTPLCNAFRANCVVIGGSISQSFDIFGNALVEQVGGICQVAPSKLLDRAALIGAAELSARSTVDRE